MNVAYVFATPNASLILEKMIPIGCFPDLYQALAGAKVDQVITL
jgi:hypothetical protein